VHGRGRSIWRRFVGDLVLTVVAAIALGALYVFLLRFAALGPYKTSIAAAVGLIVGLLFMQAIGRLIRDYLRSQGDQRHGAMVRLFFNLLVAVVIVFYVALVFGVDLQNVFLGSALAGVVLGLASQTVLGNVFAGITIVMWGPFRNGDRISVISASYGALTPSYPHETLYPAYTGTVVDIGLLYTVLQLNSGRIAKLPNAILIQALVVNLTQSPVRSIRIRMTFPYAVPLAAAEAAVAALAQDPVFRLPGRPAPMLQVADVGAQTWDAVVTVWSADPEEDRLRDLVLRGALARTPVVPPPTPAKP